MPSKTICVPANRAFFVSDLHGHKARYRDLFARVVQDEPPVVFIGGDVTPHFARLTSHEDFFDRQQTAIFSW